MPDTDFLIHKRRNIVATVVTIFVLMFVCLFAWRVYFFVSKIQSGDLTQDDLSFLQKFSASNRVSRLPIPDGEFDVVTTDDPSLGLKDAKITIVEFADFGCPFSQDASLVVRQVSAKFPDDVRFIYRDFPIIELHPDAAMAAEAGECADEQNMFWSYHDKVYANQNDLTEESLIRYATELNMNTGEFKRCLASDRNVSEVQTDLDAGVEAGVRGTPTFFLNGIRIPGAIPEATLLKLIERFIENDV